MSKSTQDLQKSERTNNNNNTNSSSSNSNSNSNNHNHNHNQQQQQRQQQHEGQQEGQQEGQGRQQGQYQEHLCIVVASAFAPKGRPQGHGLYPLSAFQHRVHLLPARLASCVLCLHGRQLAPHPLCIRADELELQWLPKPHASKSAFQISVS